MRYALITFATLAIAACGETKLTAISDGIEGCYKVTSQALADNSKLRPEVDMHIVGEIAPRPWGNFHKVLEGTTDGSFVDNNGYWLFDRGTLKIVWSNNGLSGFEVLVQPKGDGFEGIAQEFWDVEPQVTRTRKFFLKRTVCNSNK